MNKPRAMLIGLVVGAGGGLAARALAGGAPWLETLTDDVVGPIGQLFLRALFMLVIPLLFSALVVGVAELDPRALGRLGGRTLLFTAVTSLIAVLIGLGLVNLLTPGAGADPALRALATASTTIKPAPKPEVASALQAIVSMVPDNPVKAAANGDMLGVIIFAVFFGVALAATRTEAVARLRDVLQGVYDVSMTCIAAVLRVAPIGVGALVFTMTARLGGGLLKQLGAYVAVVLLGLALHLFGVYSVLLKVFARTSPLAFFRGARTAMLTAFSTASSSATLPTALKVADEQLRLPPASTRFVLTVGASMNQHGTALFEGVTVLFLAQLYGIELGLGKQLVVMVICLLAGIGTAGVPAGSMPVIAMILTLFGIPAEAIGLIFGVDRFLDMCRTTVNVTGDLVAAAVLAERPEPPPA